MGVVTSFWRGRAIWLAARLGIADAIEDSGTPLEEVARKTGALPGPLARLMAVLVSEGLFTQERGAYFRTPQSDLLRSDHPQSQRAVIDVLLGGEHYEAWGAVEAALRGEASGFEARHGANWVRYYRDHPAAARAFARAMNGTTAAFEAAVFAADPFPHFTRAVDVGGGDGGLLRRLLQLHPEAAGVVFDLPEIVASCRGGQELSGRLTREGGDFFVSAPAGGDLYLLKFILHDWDDAHAIAILKNVRAAMREAGRVAVIETVLPPDLSPHPGWLMDLNMLAITEGRERTAREFADLFARAGLVLEREIATASPLSVLIAKAAF